MRLLPYRVADGPANMAADEALLASAAAGVASLRFYGWSEPTLSLGYFQPHDPARAVPELSPLAWVRRPSGGLALVHHHELTYALALPSGSAWQPRGESWLIRMHQVIRDALLTFGVDPELCEAPRHRGEVLCFLAHTPGDLVLGDCKVGSAQRKARGALMQHGSVLLRQSPHTPALPGIAELCGWAIAAEELITMVVTALEARQGWALRAGDWTQDEERSARELAASRYRAAGWNERR